MSRIRVFTMDYSALKELLEEQIRHNNKSPIHVQAEKEKAQLFEYEKIEASKREQDLESVRLAQLKTESTTYFETMYKNDTIAQRFPKFNKGKFEKLCNEIDVYGKQEQIPQEYNDLMK